MNNSDLLPEGARTLSGLRVGLYVRISDDREELGRGVARQLEDATAHALRRGASETRVYEENDTSAYKKRRRVVRGEDGDSYFIWRVIRPVWQQMLADLRHGVIDAVVVYDIDRLARDPRDLEDAIEIAQFRSKRFEGVTGSLDLNTDSGVAMARVMVAMASKASADTARRVKRMHRELAEKGVSKSPWRPFGWNKDRTTLQPVEAELIREAVQKILAGVRVGGIVNDWAERGIRTPRGNKWVWTNLLLMLRNPRLCGYRGRVNQWLNDKGAYVNELEIVTRPDGTEVLGQWEPVITREEWDRLIAKIGKHAKPTGLPGGSSARKYLLTGFARCGACEGHLKMAGNAIRPSKRYKENFFYYCTGVERDECQGNSRTGPPVDELIRDLIFMVHDQQMSGGVVEEPRDTPEELAVRTRLDDIDGLMKDLYERWKAKKLSSDRYFAMSEDLETEKVELMANRAATTQVVADADFAEAVRRGWDDATLDEKQAFLGKYLKAVIIHPIPLMKSKTGGKMVRSPKFNPDLIEPVWIHGSPFK
ncbi:recombinase family protein [Nonomuraea maheshkhaliensis]